MRSVSLRPALRATGRRDQLHCSHLFVSSAFAMGSMCSASMQLSQRARGDCNALDVISFNAAISACAG
eukprot:6990383-Karenia_brevis.AAC.1